MPPTNADDDTIYQLFNFQLGQQIIVECQKLLANPNFRKQATPQEIHELEMLLIEAVQAYRSAQPVTLVGPQMKIAIMPIANPASAGAVLVTLALALAAAATARNAPQSVGRARDDLVKEMPRAARIRFWRELALRDLDMKAKQLLDKMVELSQRQLTRLQKAAAANALRAQAMAKVAGVAAASKAAQALTAQLAALRQVAVAALAGTALAVSLQDFRDAITKAIEEVKVRIRRIPPPPGRCDKEIKAFKEASKAAATTLNGWKKSDQLSQRRFYNAYKTFVDAYNAVIQCLGEPPLGP